MKVSGFTFVRNAVKFRYPVVQVIRSVLPLVDEMVVNVGDGEDETLDLIRSIDDSRLVIFQSPWDVRLKEGGAILAQQTDLALARCTGDVGIYVQADEAVHEDDHPSIRAMLERLHANPRAEGLIFDYVHFYGSFHTVGATRTWYRQEVRAVKTGIGVRSWRDAQGFRLGPGEAARKLRVLHSGARIYHYGWVRPPEAQLEKTADFARWYRGDAAVKALLEQGFQYDQDENVHPFRAPTPDRCANWWRRPTGPSRRYRPGRSGQVTSAATCSTSSRRPPGSGWATTGTSS